MRVVFRVDASLKMGSGHVIRCLTLAQGLQERGATCTFICREHEGNLISLINERGFEAITLPKQENVYKLQEGDVSHSDWLECDWKTDASETLANLKPLQPDWLVVDHYALDARWEKTLQGAFNKLLVIDDLADRNHDCDVLLDHNIVLEMEERYVGLTPSTTVKILGPNFALLQPEYEQAHKVIAPSFGPVKQILVNFGGAANVTLTSKVLQALSKTDTSGMHIDVVLNSGSFEYDLVCSLIRNFESASITSSVPNLIPLLQSTDLAIGASGVACLERICLGIPSLVFSVAKNQTPIAEALNSENLVVYLGEASDYSEEVFLHCFLSEQVQNTSIEWSERCLSVVSGSGINFIVAVMLVTQESKLNVRPAFIGDETTLLEWVNNPTTRENSFQQQIVSKETHHNWLLEKLSNSSCEMYILETEDEVPIGQVRFDQIGKNKWEIDFSIDWKFRGRKLAGVLLQKAISELRAIHGNIEMIGRVKDSNQSSKKIFSNLGFIHYADAHEHRFVLEVSA